MEAATTAAVTTEAVTTETVTEAPETEAVTPEETPGDSDTAADASEPAGFDGEYVCTTISFGDNIVPLDDGPYTLSIDGDTAVIVGIEELGTDTKTLEKEDGTMYWIAPDGARVFTLRLLEDGTVTLTFDTIPEAPVFRFDPVQKTE